MSQPDPWVTNMSCPAMADHDCQRHGRELEAVRSVARILASEGARHEVLLEVLAILEQEWGLGRGSLGVLPPQPADGNPAGNLQARTKVLEGEMIVEALRRTGGNMSAAARELGITARMIRYKIRKLGIDRREILGQG